MVINIVSGVFIVIGILLFINDQLHLFSSFDHSGTIGFVICFFGIFILSLKILRTTKMPTERAKMYSGGDDGGGYCKKKKSHSESEVNDGGSDGEDFGGGDG